MTARAPKMKLCSSICTTLVLIHLCSVCTGEMKEEGDVYIECGDLRFLKQEVACNGTSECVGGEDESVALCGCQDGEFQCNETICIDSIRQCDLVRDCDNGVDEDNCETHTCAGSHSKCANHMCIPGDNVCDYVDNCGDQSDEHNCERRECYPTEWRCNNSYCIGVKYLCDGKPDCQDGSDEVDCGAHFLCEEGIYLPQDMVCDGYIDCLESQADETNCGNCDSATHHQCSNNRCINKSMRCDGVCDCAPTCDDEVQCGIVPCLQEDYLVCRVGPLTRNRYSRQRCIAPELICDGHVDCLYSYSNEEKSCLSLGDSCTAPNLRCSEKQCVKPDLICDGIKDCIDGQDEQNCPSPPPCSSDSLFQCSSGQCIAAECRCDGAMDCDDYSDERQCESVECGEGTRRCPGTGQCIDDFRWCDFHWDCLDGGDELNCEPVECAAGDFRCANGQCIPPEQVCVKGVHENGTPIGCQDLSHLMQCSEKQCADDMFKCPVGYCIMNKNVCDESIHCGFSYADEDICDQACPEQSGPCKCKIDTMNCSRSNLTTLSVVRDMEVFPRLVLDGNALTGPWNESVFVGRAFISYLSVRDAFISDLPRNSFHHLWRLKYLNLENNKLTAIKNGTFAGLYSLDSLYLSGNPLQDIDPHAFTGLSNLMTLDLSGHQIRELKKNSFNGLRKLLKLDLSDNMIEYIEPGSFNTLDELQELDLANNNINIMADNVFNGLPQLQNLYTDEFRFCCQVKWVPKCLPEPTEFSSCEDLMSNAVLRVFIWILGFIAIVGNSVVIIWRLKDTRDSRVHSFLITNLAVGDFLIGVYLLVIAVVDLQYRGIYIMYDLSWRTSSLCKTAGFISMFSSELSVFTLVAITMDRFIAIIFPFKISRLGMKGARILMTFLWVVVLLLAALPLFGFSYFENFYGRSGVCLAFHMTADRPNGWHYSVFVFLALNMLSFIAILVSYLWMFIVARKTRAAARAPQSRGDRAMARRMTLIVMTDACCWVPIILLSIASLSGARFPPQVYAWIAVFVLPLNAAANPILYTISTVNFMSHARSKAFMFRKSFISSLGGSESKVTVLTGTDRVSPPSPHCKTNDNFNFDNQRSCNPECIALQTMIASGPSNETSTKKAKARAHNHRSPPNFNRGRRGRGGSDFCSSADYTRTEVLYGDDSDHY